jgi:hypothetical protein
MSEKLLRESTSMPKRKVPITHEKLLSLVSYDKETGVFTRRVSAFKAKAGDVVGNRHSAGYVEGAVGGGTYYLHRLAIFYVTGEMPEKNQQVDHIDGDRSNNAYSNLRVGSRGQNLQNLSCFGRSYNKSGHLGVHLHKASGLWRASAIIPGSRKQICSYHKTKEDAAVAAIELRKQHYPGFTGRDIHHALTL